MSDAAAAGNRSTSLRVRLLAVLMVPMLVMLGLAGTALYAYATRFGARERDRSLREDVESLARLVEMTPEEREQAKKARDLAARAKEVQKITRRLWR